jgi:mannosyltransferase OCH1-like enzyme
MPEEEGEKLSEQQRPIDTLAQWNRLPDRASLRAVHAPARIGFHMKTRNILPRCEANTIYGRRCRMSEYRKGWRFCEYHHPDLRQATIERNRIALKAYWRNWRIARGLSELPVID